VVTNRASTQPIVTATGYVPNLASPLASQGVRVVLSKPSTGPGFKYAMFNGQHLRIETASNDGGCFWVPGSSVLVDSYNSAQGPYGGANVGSQADVGNDVYSLIIRQQTTVKGNGKGNAPTPTVLGTFTPGVWTSQPATTLPPIVIPAALTSAPTAGVLTLTGTTVKQCPADFGGSTNLHFSQLVIQDSARLILEPGCRVLLDAAGANNVPSALLVKNNGTLEARGNNQIFIDNSAFSFKSTSGAITTTQNPRDLQIYATGALVYDGVSPWRPMATA